jgi:hypothetical protein
MRKVWRFLLSRLGCCVSGHEPRLSVDLLRGPVSRCSRCGVHMYGKMRETDHVRLR